MSGHLPEEEEKTPKPRPERLRRVRDRLAVLGLIGTVLSICADGTDLLASVLSS